MPPTSTAFNEHRITKHPWEKIATDLFHCKTSMYIFLLLITTKLNVQYSSEINIIYFRQARMGHLKKWYSVMNPHIPLIQQLKTDLLIQQATYTILKVMRKKKIHKDQ